MNLIKKVICFMFIAILFPAFAYAGTVPSGGSCTEPDDCEDLWVTCTDGICCNPLSITPCQKNADCCNNNCGTDEATGAKKCCLDNMNTGCSGANDCCKLVVCTSGVCCNPLQGPCPDADGDSYCCNGNCGTDESTGAKKCCLENMQTGCSVTNDCCELVVCTSGICCNPLQGPCSDDSYCCDGVCEVVAGGSKKCCLKTQTTGCQSLNDCCENVACTDGVCCNPPGVYCADANKCCPGSVCIDNICTESGVEVVPEGSYFSLAVLAVLIVVGYLIVRKR